jgi:hypothetical protein
LESVPAYVRTAIDSATEELLGIISGAAITGVTSTGMVPGGGGVSEEEVGRLRQVGQSVARELLEEAAMQVRMGMHGIIAAGMSRVSASCKEEALQVAVRALTSHMTVLFNGVCPEH